MPDYGKIIQKSIDTTKKYKWLWVYGVGLAATAGASNFNFNLPGNSNNNSSTEFDTNSLEQLFNFSPEKYLDVPHGTPEAVLGAVTNTLTDWVTKVSPQTWSLLGLGILLSIVAGIAISWVLSAWLNGSLIAGLKLAQQDKEVTLKNTSPLGIAKIKDLIILNVIQIVLLLALIVGLPLFIVALTFAFSTFARDLAPLIIVLAIIPSLFFIIQFGLTSVLAQRAVVLDSLRPWNAWKRAWKLALKNYFPSILMGIISAISSAAFGCVTNIILLVVLGIPAAIFVMPMVANLEQFRLNGYWVNIIVLILLLTAFGVANLLIRAITVVFSASNWNLWFEQVAKKGGKEK